MCFHIVKCFACRSHLSEHEIVLHITLYFSYLLCTMLEVHRLENCKEMYMDHTWTIHGPYMIVRESWFINKFKYKICGINRCEFFNFPITLTGIWIKAWLSFSPLSLFYLSILILFYQLKFFWVCCNDLY